MSLTQYCHLEVSWTVHWGDSVSGMLWCPPRWLKITPLQEDVLGVGREPLRDAVLVQAALAQMFTHLLPLLLPAAAFPT